MHHESNIYPNSDCGFIYGRKDKIRQSQTLCRLGVLEESNISPNSEFGILTSLAPCCTLHLLIPLSTEQLWRRLMHEESNINRSADRSVIFMLSNCLKEQMPHSISCAG